MTETPDNIGDMATRVAYVQHLINKAGFGEHARTFNRYGGIRGLTAEIDALRAENERAAATNRDLWVQLGHVRDLAEALKAENEQLRAVKDRPTHATPDT